MTNALMDRIKAHRSAPDVYDPPTFDQMADRIEELEREIQTLTTAGIIEVAVRNPSVMDYVKHWEGRAEAAEAKLATAARALKFYAPQTVGGITFVGGDDAGKRASAALAELEKM